MLLPRCPNMDMFLVGENDGDAYVSEWEARPPLDSSAKYLFIAPELCYNITNFQNRFSKLELLHLGNRTRVLGYSLSLPLFQNTDADSLNIEHSVDGL